MKHVAKFFFCLTVLSFVVAIVAVLMLIWEIPVSLLGKIILTSLAALIVGLLGTSVTL